MRAQKIGSVDITLLPSCHRHLGRVSHQVHTVCWQWIARPPGLTAVRNLLGVSCCFIILIPSTAVIVWLYISEAVRHSKPAPHDRHALVVMWYSIIFSSLCCVLCVVRSRSLPCIPNKLLRRYSSPGG